MGNYPFSITPPAGPAGGSLTGTYPNPGLSPVAVTTIAPVPWLPADNGLLAASGDMGGTGNTFTPTAGTLYLGKIVVRGPYTATNVIMSVSGAGSGASTGSFVGLYDNAGNRLTGSADIAGSLTSPAVVTLPVTTPQAVGALPFYWVALLTNLAVTQPTVRAFMASSLLVNVGLTAATARWASNGTLLTALPATITPASNSLISGAVWYGIT